jgi:hypothetical protein
MEETDLSFNLPLEDIKTPKKKKIRTEEDIEKKWEEISKLFEYPYIESNKIENNYRLIIMDFHIEILINYINDSILLNKQDCLRIIKKDDNLICGSKLMIEKMLDVFCLVKGVSSYITINIPNSSKTTTVKLINDIEITRLLFEAILKEDNLKLYTPKVDDIKKYDSNSIYYNYLTLKKLKNYLVYRKPYTIEKPSIYESSFYKKILFDLFYNTRLLKIILLHYNKINLNTLTINSNELSDNYINEKKIAEEKYKKLKNKNEPVVLSNYINSENNNLTKI